MAEETRMEIVCAWCGKHMGWKDGKGETGISHSICPECSKKEKVKAIRYRPPPVLEEDIDIISIFLLYHSMPHMDTEHSPGIVVYPEVAKASPCKCAKVDGTELCFSPGIIGAMDEGQKELYCNPKTSFKSPALQKRLTVFKQAVKAAQKKVKEIPKGQRLEPWLAAMSEELSKRGGHQ